VGYGAAKSPAWRISGTEIPPPAPLFPVQVGVYYSWRADGLPSIGVQGGSLPLVGLAASTTLGQLLQQARAAILVQEQAADGGGHTVGEEVKP